ncbi:sucrose transport protein SUT4 isoform X2 [Cryptomeria japonica]|uniref:sucrose transport protein SUT4 isoform X2 n=1 Tax=Cryptomeria japonica TaxID=3369 RepID=UPI0027DA0CD4|nr:sucrose transport protein SUT4 isoform X2 [Cryptomeria japonica]
MSSKEFRVPYQHLEQQIELSAFSTSPESNSRPENGQTARSESNAKNVFSLRVLILATMIGAGVQFGWALQGALLTPYIQTLGIGHQFSSFIWLCGPITGLVVQPIVGVWSDKCQSIYGRRRPFIFSGALMICFAVTLIGFSADIGYLLGDTHESCNTYKGTRPRAAVVFVIGFWMLDLANNTVGGPARALLADLSGSEQRNFSNAIYTSWLAFGNILGFSAGASGQWHRWFPFLTTKACCEACGNLKAAFMVAVVFLLICTAITLCFAQEIPLAASLPQKTSDSAPLLPLQVDEFRDTGITNPKLDGIHVEGNGKESPLANNDAMVQSPKMEEDEHEEFKDGSGGVLVNILTSMRHLPPAMRPVLLVMAFSWLSWFPFFLFDTDWMGREVYHGDPKGNATEAAAYQKGVQEGAFGLLLNSVVLGVSSFLIDPLCRWRGSKDLWAASNFIVFVCMASTAVISAYAVSEHHKGIQYMIGNVSSVKAASVALFALLGFPLAITYSIPFSVTAELTADAGGGQGLATGVLNLAIVIPQIVVALGAGPWDALFGGGNVPAFVLAALFALAAGIIAVMKLPNLSSTSYKPAVVHGFG